MAREWQYAGRETTVLDYSLPTKSRRKATEHCRTPKRGRYSELQFACVTGGTSENAPDRGGRRSLSKRPPLVQACKDSGQTASSHFAMSPRPTIFISSVSKELRSARQLVANTLTFLGYEPIWQDIFGTETGDLRQMLRDKIDQSKGVVQLIGQCYGAEPAASDEHFGRVSYTQYEALYARQRGKRIWYLFIDETFPIDAHEPEPEELRELQLAYRRRVQSDTHVFHSLTTTEGLEASVLKLRDDLTHLRRGVTRWAASVTALLLFVAGLVIWQLHGQSQMKAEIAKLREGIMQYPHTEALVRGSRILHDSFA